MQAPWEYFEHFSDLVYVSDIDTHELVYLNRHARELYGFPSEADYKGHPCYEVMQHAHEPCTFCTCRALLESGAAEWVYRNPVTAHTFRIKDSLIEYSGCRYHVTLAINMDRSELETYRFNSFVHYEAFVNECLIFAFAASDEPDESLNLMLQYIGQQQAGLQLSIYERVPAEHRFQSTYCWPPSSAGTKILPFDLEQYLSQQYPGRDITEPLVLSSGQELQRHLPVFCDQASAGGDQSLLLVPLLLEGRISGYLRLDNAPPQQLRYLSDICKVLSPFITTTMQRRDLLHYFKNSSMYDQMTGALNRRALKDHIRRECPLHSIGLVYCDLIGLKSINDLLGHNSGDELIVRIFHILQKAFPTQPVYRMGGDEFLVLCDNTPQPDFEQSVAQLRVFLAESNCELSIGSLWTADTSQDIRTLIQKADDLMYQDKRKYYSRIDLATGQTRHSTLRGSAMPPACFSSRETAFQNFLSNYFFDPEVFFQSVAMADTTFYLYCGDMQKNVYFISDNLKDEFNFTDNLVYNFVDLLEQRIYKPDQALHIADLQDMIEKKRKIHTIRYRIYNKAGQLLWIHCRGIMKWDAEMARPLFFSGSMVCLKNEDAVDSTTGLLNLSSAEEELSAICSVSRSPLLLLSFAFQPLADINLAFGRETGDAVLREIGCQLEIQMGTFFRFFRLSDNHFLAFSHKNLKPALPVQRIRNIMLDACAKYGIHMMYPCAAGVLHYPEDGATAQELIDNAIVVANVSAGFPSLDYLKFSPHMIQNRREQSSLGFTLNYSVNHGFEGFHIVVQPQVEAATQQIFGGEVLLRWSMHGQNVSLSQCIATLEQQGVIVPVGKWVITQTARAAQHILSLRPDFRFSINISYLQLLDDGLFPHIRQTLQQFHIPAHNLLIELTETHHDSAPERLEAFIRQCKEIGISFVLDDFGTAYSNLSLLLQHPADLIKLDQTLIHGITSSKQKLDFIASIIYSCHRFGKQVCVEGVETEDEFNLIRQTGCDFIQGFYFYRPLDLDALGRLLETPEGTISH